MSVRSSDHNAKAVLRVLKGYGAAPGRPITPEQFRHLVGELGHFQDLDDGFRDCHDRGWTVVTSAPSLTLTEAGYRVMQEL